jgi:microcystin-dependent protein
MQTPYIGEIQLVAHEAVPNGWRECDGTLLQINQYQALFSLLGTTYGGNGQTTFALPDLRGRIPVMPGGVAVLGSKFGTETETLDVTQLPGHAHDVSGLTLSCASSSATLRSPVGAVPAAEARGVTAIYGSGASAMSPQAISGFAPELASAGGSQPHDNRAPYLALKYLIATSGLFPAQSGVMDADRGAFVGEISMFAGTFAPGGWAFCAGALLPISQNTALFSLLGTYYGGNGKSDFALPNLSGKTPMGTGTGPGGSEYEQGFQGGAESVTLAAFEMPVHTHPIQSGGATPALRCFSGAGNASTPVANVPAAEAFGATAIYRPAADSSSAMSYPTATQTTGSGLPHNNRPPSLGVNFIIALQGVFPAPQ